MWNQVQQRINRAIDKIRNGMYGKISSVIKGDRTVYIEISEDEEIRDVRILSPYGLFSIPTNDMFGQVIFNNSSKKVNLIGVEDGNFPVEIDIGEVLVYNKIAKTYIHLKNNKTIAISGKLDLDYEALQSLKQALNIL